MTVKARFREFRGEGKRVDLLRRLDESAPQAVVWHGCHQLRRCCAAYLSRPRTLAVAECYTCGAAALGRLKNKLGAILALYNFRTQWLTLAVSDIP